MNTTATASGRPLVPSDLGSPSRALERACYAVAVSQLRGMRPAELCLRVWNDPVAAAVVQRAAVSGASSTVSGWAAELAAQSVARWLPTLYPMSAIAGLISRGITLPLGDGISSIRVPGRASTPTPAGFVSQQGAIPVRQDTVAAVTMQPRKVALLVTMSRELAKLSNASEVFTMLLSEESSMSLDAAYLSTAAGTATVHAGLLAGLTPVPGSAVMTTDLATLAHAVGTGGSGQVVFIMGPGRAAAAKVRQPGEAGNAEILASLAVPETRIIALDPTALCHGFGDQPDIASASEATLRLSDTPLDIGTPGSPPTVAAPTSSMFQTATLATRMILDVSFVARRANAAAYIDTGATW